MRAVFLLLFLTCQSIQAGWIDPDTPEDAMVTEPYKVIPGKVPKDPPTKSNKTAATAPPTASPTSSPTQYPTSTPGTFRLVFSDEFEVAGRSFEDGTDTRWTALEKNDYTNNALHYYAAANAVTDNKGRLVITTEAADTDVIGYNDSKKEKAKVTKHFRSAMLQTWNKFCFTGGIIEAKVQLPGKSDVGGLWPAFWLLGNLARHTYVGSSEHIWPWSSKVCTERSFESQHITACDQAAHFGLEPGVGRGSPEIDIFEVQPGSLKANQGVFLRSPVGQPFMSASFQVAPGRSDLRPGPGYWPGPGQWYDGWVDGDKTALNIGFYGSYNHFEGDPHPAKSDYWSDAISFNRQLDESFFNSTHVYRLEWDVPTDEKDGYLRWFLDGELVVSLNGTGIRNAGTGKRENCFLCLSSFPVCGVSSLWTKSSLTHRAFSRVGSEISTEPSYILLNTAISKEWGFPKECPMFCDCMKYDCHSNDFAYRCGFSDGFCQMMAEDNPKYKIHYVRVYQNPDLPEQKVGCSTPERPTKRYIEAHEKLYKTAQDVS